MTYEEFLKLARAFTLWRFTMPRKQNGSPVVVIADTFYSTGPKTDKLIIVDIKKYAPGEPNTAKPVPALDFFTLYEKGVVEQYIPE